MFNFRSVVRPNGTLLWINTFFLALSLWLFNHPFVGVDFHDARIYLVLALHWLDPAAFARDPFFLFGSQDSYSIFSSIFGTLIRWIDIVPATLCLLFTGAVLWVVAAIVSAQTFLIKPIAWVTAALACAALSINYSPSGSTFVLNENFLTARTFAFPLGVMAVTLWVRKMDRSAWAIALLSCAIHPLIGIWVVLFGFLFTVNHRIALLCFLGAGILGLGLCFSGVSPFDFIDDEWLGVISANSTNVLIGPFDTLRTNELLLLLVAPVLARLACLDEHLARAYLVIVAVALSGLLASLVVSYFWPVRLLVQLQLWRSLWLLAFVFPVAIVQVVLMLARVKLVLPGTRMAVPWVLIVFFSFAVIFWSYLSLALLFVTALMSRRFTVQRIQLAQFAIKNSAAMLIATAVLFCISLPFYISGLEIHAAEIAIPLFGQYELFKGFFVNGGGGLGFLIWAACLVLLSQSHYLSFVVALGLLPALLSWDARYEQRTLLQAMSKGELHVTPAFLKKGDVVYWPGQGALPAWYGLRTSSYASPLHATGFVFSREKTFELIRRGRVMQLSVGHLPIEGRHALAENLAQESVPKSQAHILALCNEADLDWVVLAQLLDWESRQAVVLGDRTVYFYGCHR